MISRIAEITYRLIERLDGETGGVTVLNYYVAAHIKRQLLYFLGRRDIK